MSGSWGSGLLKLSVDGGGGSGAGDGVLGGTDTLPVRGSGAR